ncbi:MAG: phosphomannomutase, partial [Pseudomonadota bacterium]|nr:phosphomannomutase [Pseudomonadota bacterium]
MDVGFGTSGLRGPAEALLDGAAAKHARAFCLHLLDTGKLSPGGSVCIAADRRPSSPALIETCIQAVSQAGLHPLNCGEVPTPALAHHAMARDAAAIMVTGSHIPADRNGLKFYLPTGEITKQDEHAIAELAADRGSGHSPSGRAIPADTHGCREAVIAGWLERYRGVLPSDA